MDVVRPNHPGQPMAAIEMMAAFDHLQACEFSRLAEALVAPKILFIVNDTDRATPTAKILGHVDEYLQKNGESLKTKPAEVMVATGSHAPPKEEGLRRILGGYYEHFKPHLKIHRAQEGDFDLIGHSARGTPIKIDRQIYGYDRIISINSIEPHYFAGYTGGRKSLVPGICHWETIEANHKFAMEASSRVLSLENNPVHLDMLDVAAKILAHLESRHTKVIAINAVESGGQIYALAAGDIFQSWASLLPKANSIFTATIQGRYDIVIAETASPQNKNLYQALKAFEHGKIALREGGVLILVASCQDGLGPDEFYKVITSAPTPAEIVEKVRQRYTLGAHKTTNLLAFLKNHKLFVVSELPDEIVKNCFARPFKTVDEALQQATIEGGVSSLRILKIKEANNVVPLVTSAR